MKNKDFKVFVLSILKEGNIINVANFFSFYRIAASPFIYIFSKKSITSEFYYIANIVLVATIIISDYLDGFFSRKLHIKTVMGRYLDPLADKVALFFAIISLYKFYGFPLFMIIIAIIREILILSLAIGLTMRERQFVKTNKASKIAFFLLAVLVLLYYFQVPQLYKTICLPITLAFYLISPFLYIKESNNFAKR